MVDIILSLILIGIAIGFIISGIAIGYKLVTGTIKMLEYTLDYITDRIILYFRK